MADTVTLRIRETGASQVAGGFRKVDGALGRMGRTGSRAASRLAASFGSLGGVVGRFSGMIGGLGVALGGKALLKFDDALGQLQADANLSNGELNKLRGRFLQISTTLGVTKEELLEGAQEWQDYTGILTKMIPVMGDVAKIHKATGTPMANLATISASLIQSLGMSPQGAVEVLAKLNEQSRAGAINMRKAAAVLPELLAAGAGYGFTGERGATQMGMLLQTAGAATGGKAEEARTQALAIMRDLTKNAAKLKKMGVTVFDPDNPKQMRDVDKIMGEIMAKTGGAISGKTGLGKIFAEESIKGALAFSNQGAVSAQREAGARGGLNTTIAEQLRVKLTGVAAESEKVKQAMAQLDAAFQTYGKKLLVWAAQNPWTAAGAAAGGLAALKGGGGILRWLLAGRGKGGAAGALGGATGVQPVFVVNMPGAHFGEAAAYGLGPKTAGPTAAGGASRLAKAGAGLGALSAGLAIGTAIDEGIGALTGKKGSTWIGDAAAQAIHGRSAAERAGYGQSVVGQNLTEQAAMLGKLGAGGATSYQSQGGTHALTQENALATLQASAAKQGATPEVMAALLPVLRQLTANLAKGAKVTVVAPGIDAPRVATSRG